MSVQIDRQQPLFDIQNTQIRKLYAMYNEENKVSEKYPYIITSLPLILSFVDTKEQ